MSHSATDNHIGYLEKDPLRGNDSLEAFEEILKMAKEQDVSAARYIQKYWNHHCS